MGDTDAQSLLRNHREAAVEVPAEFLKVSGKKVVPDVSSKKMGFLRKVRKVIQNLRPFWPLSVRQIHYQLLNDPPLTSEPKNSKHDLEKHRYRNDQASYKKLVELLRQARYNGHISMNTIDDPTRPSETPGGYRDVASFIDSEFQRFLTGYHLDRQRDQPRHIEVLGEKNTLYRIILPVCEEYYVPLTLARGYGSIPIWREIATRFERSGKAKMTLIVASDYDPEGIALVPREPIGIA